MELEDIIGRCCVNCKFYGHQADLMEGASDDFGGACHYNPPEIIDIAVTEEEIMEVLRCWPPVSITDWCGKWEAGE